MSEPIKVGTRGSRLALVQADLVIDALRQSNPGAQFEREIIRTAGDRDKTTDIANVGYGVFVSELENALLDGRIGIAVHSLKDMPSKLGSEFAIAAVPYREDPRDVIISRNGAGLMDLPTGATVGTGSARRKTLLLEKRPDLKVVPIRGNVPTRLDKLDSEDGPDAIVLAAAGLNRLGLSDRVSEYLKCWDFVAAVGQGALAVETRAEDASSQNMAKLLQHHETRIAVDAERTFLAAMESGCSAPVSAHARVRGSEVSIHSFAGSVDGSKVLRAERAGEASNANSLALELAEELLDDGAAELTGHQPAGAE